MTLYLDLDGVFADFDGQLKNYGVHRNDTSFQHTDPHGWTDEQIALDKEVRRCMGIPGFWEKMGVCPGSYPLWSYCKQYNPTILTAVPKIPEWRDRVEFEKRNWVDRYLGIRVPMRFCLRSEKKGYAKSFMDVLLDDMEQNIKEWNEADGVGVLHKSPEESIKTLNHIYTEVC